MKKGLVLFLAAVLLTPVAFFSVPSHTKAGGIITFDPENFVKNTITALESTLSANSTLSLQIKAYVLDPLARALAQQVLKSITASVVNWINGSNSAGSPLYVQNLGTYLGAIGDNQALNFIAQITNQSNSPFAPVIASSLQTNYLQSTSLAGFWAANSCTLNQASPNINAFVSGQNFNGNGGWGAFLSLSTQPQNNPYSLYFRTQAQLASSVSAAQTQRSQQLANGQGFLSWCSGGGTTSGGSVTSTVGAGSVDIEGGGTLTSTGAQLTTNTIQLGTPALANSATKGAQSPGDPCVNSDGTYGTIETPGSVINSELTKTLGSGVDSLVNTTNFNQMVDTIFSALITQVVGGGGLGGVSSSGYSTQLQTSSSLSAPSATGGTTASGITSTANSAISTTQGLIASYTAAWQTIAQSAQTASSSVQAVINCENTNDSGDPYGAVSALNSEIAPVLTQNAQASTNVTNAQAMITQTQNDSNSVAAGSLSASGALASDLQTLAAIPPQASDVATAQSNAEVTNSATSSSSTSLAVSGGSTVDQMNLITTNAANALNACQNLTLPQTASGDK